MAMHAVADAVTQCKFEATDPAADEVVLYKILQVCIQHVCQCDASNHCSDTCTGHDMQNASDIVAFKLQRGVICWKTAWQVIALKITDLFVWIRMTMQICLMHALHNALIMWIRLAMQTSLMYALHNVCHLCVHNVSAKTAYPLIDLEHEPRQDHMQAGLIDYTWVCRCLCLPCAVKAGIC